MEPFQLTLPPPTEKVKDTLCPSTRTSVNGKMVPCSGLSSVPLNVPPPAALMCSVV
jgi:hypothetical protein